MKRSRLQKQPGPPEPHAEGRKEREPGTLLTSKAVEKPGRREGEAGISLAFPSSFPASGTKESP